MGDIEAGIAALKPFEPCFFEVAILFMIYAKGAPSISRHQIRIVHSLILRVQQHCMKANTGFEYFHVSNNKEIKHIQVFSRLIFDGWFQPPVFFYIYTTY